MSKKYNTKTAGQSDHYKARSIQPWDVIDNWNLNFFLGNVVKYVGRAGLKNLVKDNDIEDLKKARDYLDFEINRRIK